MPDLGQCSNGNQTHGTCSGYSRTGGLLRGLSNPDAASSANHQGSTISTPPISALLSNSGQTEKMAATILDGNKIADEIRTETAAEVARLSAQGIRPGLAAVLVGQDPGSEIYVRNKVKTCEQLGLYSE